MAEEAQGEAHISAQQASPLDTARVPSPDEDPRRARDRPVASAEGPRAPLGLIGRVSDRATFDALRREGRRARRGPMTVVHLPGDGEVRVAFSIGRKVGPAVVRNTLRRRLRAAARDLDRSTGGLPTGAYLIMLRPEAAGRSYRDLHHDLGRAITSATAAPTRSRHAGGPSAAPDGGGEP